MSGSSWIGDPPSWFTSTADRLTFDTHVAVDDDVIPELDASTAPDPATGGRRAPESRHGVTNKAEAVLPHQLLSRARADTLQIELAEKGDRTYVLYARALVDGIGLLRLQGHDPNDL